MKSNETVLIVDFNGSNKSLLENLQTTYKGFGITFSDVVENRLKITLDSK